MTPFLAHFKGINGGDGRSCILQRSHLYLLRGGVAGYCPETSFGPRSVGRRCGCWQRSRLPSQTDTFFLDGTVLARFLYGPWAAYRCAARPANF